VTYCVGLLLNAGLVLLSDTRTNAGVDDISIYRKMFIFERPGDRVIVIMTSGNLSVTQTVIARLQQQIDDPDASHATSIMLAGSMLDVAQMVGSTLFAVGTDINARLQRTGPAGSASLIVAGQRAGGRPRLFLLYREGNFIEATEDTPFLQIGEFKYGKPILDRVVRPEISPQEGRKAVLLSMDSTMRSNLSVGMPLDLAIIRRDEHRVSHRERIEPGDPAFTALSAAWSQALGDAFANMPG
jgi:putative proteasome-type protease